MHYVLPDPFSMGLRVSGNKGTRLRAGHVLVIDNVEDVVNTLEIHIFNVHIQILHPATTSYVGLTQACPKYCQFWTDLQHLHPFQTSLHSMFYTQPSQR